MFGRPEFPGAKESPIVTSSPLLSERGPTPEDVENARRRMDEISSYNVDDLTLELDAELKRCKTIVKAWKKQQQLQDSSRKTLSKLYAMDFDALTSQLQASAVNESTSPPPVTTSDVLPASTQTNSNSSSTQPTASQTPVEISVPSSPAPIIEYVPHRSKFFVGVDVSSSRNALQYRVPEIYLTNPDLRRESPIDCRRMKLIKL